jgi:hypothetical protein
MPCSGKMLKYCACELKRMFRERKATTGRRRQSNALKESVGRGSPLVHVQRERPQPRRSVTPPLGLSLSELK